MSGILYAFIAAITWGTWLPIANGGTILLGTWK